MSFDANAYREASLQGWEDAASGWVSRQEQLRRFAAPVSHWMLDAVSLQPGQRVLELAAGLGETGMLAAELVAPMGSVTISDQAQATGGNILSTANEIPQRKIRNAVVERIDGEIPAPDVLFE